MSGCEHPNGAFVPGRMRFAPRVSNLVFTQHNDSSMDVYSHLMHDGVRVAVGQV